MGGYLSNKKTAEGSSVIMNNSEGSSVIFKKMEGSSVNCRIYYNKTNI